MFVFRDQVAGLESLGYAGSFLINLVSSATIILPVPGIVFVFTLGAVWNPLFIGVAGGVGAALGELTGYAAGYSGQTLFEGSQTYSRIAQWTERRGAILIFLFSLVPNPIFDMVGLASGALRYPLWRFLFFCLLGKVPRCIAIAYAGSLGLEWLPSWLVG